MCTLPFFSITTGPFVLKIGMMLHNSVRETANHFGDDRRRTYRMILKLVIKAMIFVLIQPSGEKIRATFLTSAIKNEMTR